MEDPGRPTPGDSVENSPAQSEESEVTRKTVNLICDGAIEENRWRLPQASEGLVAHQQPMLQGLLDLHMFLAGCLLVPRRTGPDDPPPSTQCAVAALLIAAAAHDVITELFYAHLLPQSGGAQKQLQMGAQIMYYGGNAIEVFTARY